MVKVYGVIVAYNFDPDELKAAVLSLKKQVSKVILCNNTTSYLSSDEFPDVKIYNFGNNLGIAYAQSVAMEWAFSNGADFVLQLDQDSILENSTVRKLTDSFNDLSSLGYRIGALGPLHFDKVRGKVDYNRLPKGIKIPGTSCEIVKHTLSSACLIPKQAFEKTGNIDKDLFIDLVDWEYCWRLRKNGFEVVRDNSVLLPHQVGNGYQDIINGVNVRKPAPIRHYYHSRNVILMLHRSYVPFSFKIRELSKLLIKIFLYRFIFKDGLVRWSFLARGIIDGLRGKKGKYENFKH
jgi:rhamnosyltransferase